MTTPLTVDEIFGSAPTSPEDTLDAVGARLVWVNEQLAAFKDEKKKLEDKVWTMTEEEPGEVELSGAQYSFIVARSEQWKWNSEKLETLAASNPHVDAVVQSSFKLTPKNYEALKSTLPHPELVKLDDALTRGVGKPRVKVTKKAGV